MQDSITLQIDRDEHCRFIGKIPIRNLWLLMLYASDLYRQIGTQKITVEDNPENTADLVAEILCHQVEQRLIRSLSYGYQHKTAIVSRVRGRINMFYTERHQLLNKGKVNCTFEELTVDTPRNRYVRAALETLIKLVNSRNIQHKCRLLASNLSRLGVSQGKPSGYNGKSERFGQHDSDDRKMIAAADLAFSLALPTENHGQNYLTEPEKKQEWLRKLFEKGIAGFYSVVLDKSEWAIKAGKQHNWQITEQSAGIAPILPSMQTDIIIDSLKQNKRLIIDTKFNAITTKGWHRPDTLRNGYIYQMYTYLRSQENIEKPLSLTASGMLLHPSIDKDVNEFVTIQGHKINFCTVNLGGHATQIKNQLLQILNQAF